MNVRLPLLRYALWVAVFAAVGCGRKSIGQVVGESPSRSMSRVTTATQSPTVVPSSTSGPEAKANQSPSSDLARLEASVRPSVIWVTMFDPKGNLLRTESGFFISQDGRFVTTARAIEGAVNAVAKTGDGGIYNVSGILAVSKELDLAILEAELKPRKLVRFLDVNKDPDVPAGTGVVSIGSGLAGNEGSPKEMTIAEQKAEHLELTGATPPSSVGCPLVDETGAVVGVVTSAGEKTGARSSAALESLLSRVAADTHAHWLARAEASATPRATSKPRLVYAPPPSFPPGASLPGQSGTGRFRLTFDPAGNVTNIQLVQSTGIRVFDESAIRTLQQWRCSPGQGWAVTVPVTFRTR